MANTFTTKVLADGQIASSAADVFTATATTYVKQFTLFNDNAAQQTIIIWLNTSGTNRKVRQIELNQNESAELLDGGQAWILENGDKIRASTTTASAVDYTIAGVEET